MESEFEEKKCVVCWYWYWYIVYSNIVKNDALIGIVSIDWRIGISCGVFVTTYFKAKRYKH